MKNILTIFFLLIGGFVSAQTILTVEGQTFTSGYPVPHSTPTTFIFRNNSLTTTEASYYMLSAGDELPTANNNKLDGAVITGNRVIYNGISSATHGLFVGYNINDIIQYNYIDKAPYGLVTKSGNAGSGMTFTSGGVAYNIFRNNEVAGVIVRGIKNVPIYNNTFYCSLTAVTALIFIEENEANGNTVSTGTKIKNNIFYTTNRVNNIFISDLSCIAGFESDYNVFYCASGTPRFGYGTSVLTFAQWQALGYDTHSVVINPNFNNTNDLVPATRLNYGTDLGTIWQSGLSTTATWTTGSSPLKANQNGTWQAGARIYDNVSASVTYVSSAIANATPSVLEMTYNINLANIVPSAASFQVLVNSAVRAVNTVVVSGTKVMLTLASKVVNGDVVTVAYTKPAANPLQSASGVQAASLSAQPVTNNVIAASPPVFISAIIQNTTPNILEMTYSLSLAAIIPVPATFSVKVNNVARTVNTVSVSGTKVLLTLASNVIYGDIITVAYTKPAGNPLQTPSGGQAATISSQPVTNKITAPVNLPPVVSISTPGNGSLYIAPATITIVANASDPDGTISKVEFFSGSVKLGERTTPPYSYIWSNVTEGTYSLNAVATDNLNSTKSSSLVSVTVEKPSPGNKPPVIKITNPVSGKLFVAPVKININVVASDSDGTITKVEYFNGLNKIGESSVAPYSISYEITTPGTVDLIASATDNLNAVTTSTVNIYATKYDMNSELINLYPNPNDGHFSIEILTALENEKNMITISDLSGKIVYSEMLSKEETLKQFDLSRLNTGIYILIISNDKIIITKKFIKK